MIVEINYIALHLDSYQGGIGKPFTGRILIEVDGNTTIKSLCDLAKTQLEHLAVKNRRIINHHKIVNLVIEQD